MNESNIPIDINIGKLLDWLVSRRHVNKDWQNNVLPIREKINNAIQDMPAHDGIVALLTGTYINYFNCIKIVEILKETEADSKNMFGRYGSQRMKDWQDVIKSYEKDNLYVAEAAQMLIRNINYEIPSMKKQIVKLEQIQTECDKKEADYFKSEATAKTEFNNTCKQLGIKGDDIKSELVEKLKELPEIYDKIGSSLKPLLPAIDLYETFTRYVSGDGHATVLPLLRHVVQRGNTTVYEWNYGEAPLVRETDAAQLHTSQVHQDIAGGGLGIDFGDDLQSPAADSIDFDGIEDVTLEDGGDIDWGNIGDVDTTVSDDLAVNMAEISLEESGIVVERDGVSGGVARGSEAQTLLDCPNTRDSFIDQLVELESFLKMRLHTISSGGSEDVLSSLQELPSESIDALSARLSSVQDALTQITLPKVTHLHNIKHSPRYVDMLTAQLKQKLSLCEKICGCVSVVRQRRSDARQQASLARPALERVIQKTKELQEEIEKDISKKYKNRPVNIIGGVKFLF